jgi:hypothetical protein
MFSFMFLLGVNRQSQTQGQEGMIFEITLEDLRHPQPKIPVHCDNAMALGIANNTIIRQQSQAMEIRYF